jgi:hypothetical protein
MLDQQPKEEEEDEILLAFCAWAARLVLFSCVGKSLEMFASAERKRERERPVRADVLRGDVAFASASCFIFFFLLPP